MRPSRRDKIYAEQDRILTALKKLRNFPFVLSGGTALSRFYFHHRFSEDLDFFCEEIDFSFEKIEKIMILLRKEGFSCKLSTQSARPGHLAAAIYEIGRKTRIKVDFLEDPFSGMWNPVQRKSDAGYTFRVDALDQIYYRKFFALIEQWHKIRRIRRTKDLVDLYALHRYHRSIEKTVEYYRRHRVPVLEEKLIVIFDSLDEDDLKGRSADIAGLQKFNLAEVCRRLKRAGENLLNKGLA